MERDDVMQLSLDTAKDEYQRGQARLGLVETKAQLISATVGILITILLTIPPDRIPHANALHAVFLIGAAGSLVISLVISVAASYLKDVRPPQSASAISTDCQSLLGAPGTLAVAVDAARAEVILGNLIGSYLVATSDVMALLKTRLQLVKQAQITLMVGLITLLLLIGIPLLQAAFIIIRQSGGHLHG